MNVRISNLAEPFGWEVVLYFQIFLYWKTKLFSIQMLMLSKCFFFFFDGYVSSFVQCKQNNLSDEKQKC